MADLRPASPADRWLFTDALRIAVLRDWFFTPLRPLKLVFRICGASEPVSLALIGVICAYPFAVLNGYDAAFASVFVLRVALKSGVLSTASEAVSLPLLAGWLLRRMLEEGPVLAMRAFTTSCFSS